MKFGIKIPLNVFSNEQSESSKKLISCFGGIAEMLDAYATEVDSVELGAVGETTSPELLCFAAEQCHSHGLDITVHGLLPHGSPDDFFLPYKGILKTRNTPLNVTVHPLAPVEESIQVLKAICCRIEAETLPLRITLENQRYRSEETAGMGCKTVTEIAKAVNSDKLFLCFDFGHQLSNIRNEIPPIDTTDDAFFSRVKHTHIHSLFEGKTHFPLSCGETAFDYNLTNLFRFDYDEVLMLELDPDRYWDRFDVKESAFASIRILKKATALAASKRNAEKNYNTYGERISRSFEMLKNTETGIIAIAPAGYIVRLGDTLIAIDPAPNWLPISEADKALAADLVASCDGVIVTHNHSDHFDKALLNALPDNLPVYTPDFLPYKNKNSLCVTNGTVAELKDVAITFFDSPHSRDENIVLEYGVALAYKGKNYLFPTDVRDYLKPYPSFENVETLVAHLWLGRENAIVGEGDYAAEFLSYFSSFGAEKHLVSHLLDTRRTIEDMWDDSHFDIIKDGLKNSKMLKVGDFSEL